MFTTSHTGANDFNTAQLRDFLEMSLHFNTYSRCKY